MIAQSRAPDVQASLQAYLPKRPNRRHRDARAGAVLLAIAAAMALNISQEPEKVLWTLTNHDVARAAILPAFTGVGFLFAAFLVRNGQR